MNVSVSASSIASLKTPGHHQYIILTNQRKIYIGYFSDTDHMSRFTNLLMDN